FVIMPLVGLGLSVALQLPAELAAGVILVGCAPGGTSSNVITYLSRADTALSVTMTSISTLLAPLLTPLLTLLLAGQYMEASAGDMALTIVKIVLLPVVGGLVVRLLLSRLVDRVLPALPWVSVIAISLVVAAVVANSAEQIVSAGLLVLLAVVLHNGLGYLLGYGAGRLLRQPVRSARTISIEVGMQNSGLAAGLAAQYFSPVAALPGAVFSIWHNLSGAVLAAIYRRTARGSGPGPAGASAATLRPSAPVSSCGATSSVLDLFARRFPAQHVTRLAVQHPADRRQRGEPHRLRAPVLEHGHVRRAQTDPLGKLPHPDPTFGQQHVQVDDDRHSDHIGKLVVHGDRGAQQRPH